MPEENIQNKLPGLSELFKDSWNMFKGSILHVFIVNIIGFGIYFGLFIILLLITVPLGVFSFLQFFKTNTLNPATLTSFGAIGIVLLIFLIACVIVGIALNAATILIVANYKKSPPIGEVIKKGFGLVVPLFLVNLLLTFIITGGYFLFIIPGIFLAIILSFTVYEIVLAESSVLGAARRSMTIILSHFWGIFGRMLLWVIIVISVVNIPNALTFSSNNYSAGVGGLQFILQILVAWFGISYSVTLYMQAAKAAKPGNSKLLWPLIVGFVGWIVGIIVIGMLIAFLVSTVIPQIQQNFKPKKSIRNTVAKEIKKETIKMLPTLNPQKINLKNVQKQ